MKVKYFLIFILGLFFWPLAGQAYSLSYDGCWQKSDTAGAIVLNLKAMSCQITASGTPGEILSFTLEYVDPDYFTVDNYDALSKSENELIFSKTLASGQEIININPWSEPEDNFWWVMMSDPQPNYDEWYDPVHQEILKQVETINPYFTLLAGDLTNGDPDESTQRDYFDGFLYVMEENLNTPWFSVPGNHDVEAGLDLYQEYLGDSYYSFDFGQAHFMGLSTEEQGEEGEINGQQYNWLENDLVNNNSDNKIAFWHRALVPPAWSSYTGWDNPDQANIIAGLLDQQRVDLVLNGHNHGYDYQFVDGQDFSSISNGFHQLVSAGAGGALTQTDGYYHYILAQVQNGEISHQAVPYSTFPLTKSTNQQNDGTEEEVTFVLTNSSEADWPWVRLKYKIDPVIENLHAVDSEGNYYEVSDYLFDDYHVAYVETEVPALGSKEITVKKNSKAHQGLINTFNTVGQVSYSQTPESVATEVSLEAQTSKKTTQIRIQDWDSRKWRETAAKKDVDTTYILGDLNPDYCYVVAVNDLKYGRYCADSEGEINFSYRKNVKQRDFQVFEEEEWYPEKIAAVPASEGGSQIRLFNSQGEVLTQFLAYQSSWQGGFNLAWGDVDGDHEGELVVSPKEGNPPLLKVFDDDGNLMAKKRVFNKNYTKGVELALGDVDNNGSDEIVVAGPKRIKIYRYLKKKEKLKLVTAKEAYSDFTGGIDLTLAQINDNNKKEIIVTPDSGQEKIKIYKFSKQKIKLLAEENIYQENYSGISLGVGDIDKKGRAELVFVPKGGSDALKIYRLTKDNKLKFIKRKKISADYAAGVNVLVGDLNGQPKAEIILAPQGAGDRVEIYRYLSDKTLKKVDNLMPYGPGYGQGMFGGLADVDNDCDLELIITPLQGAPNARLYDYGKELELKSWWWAYEEDFTGGVKTAEL